MKIEKVSKEILFHADAYKEGTIDQDDFTQAVEEILDVKNSKELLDYIDWESLSKDYKLESGECPPEIVFGIEDLLERFININK